MKKSRNKSESGWKRNIRRNSTGNSNTDTSPGISSTPSSSSPSVQMKNQGQVSTTASNNTVTGSSTVTGGPRATTSSIGSNSSTNPVAVGHFIPSDILDDLASRFIINVPDDQRNNLIRICFQIELAHWFYLDFFCATDGKHLNPCGIKQFALHLFNHIPFLRQHLPRIDLILEDWKDYKLTVPTYGAVLMTEDLKFVLLVQSYWAKCSWGFPKGKINENEEPIHCAAREVYEETGFDITKLIKPKQYVEAVINYQYTRLYLVRNIPYETTFIPRTRKEIKYCEWFPIDLLPTNKNDTMTKTTLGINANSFFMIMPFIKRLKQWVFDNRNVGQDTQRPAIESVSSGVGGGSSSSSKGPDEDAEASVSARIWRQRHKSTGDIDQATASNWKKTGDSTLQQADRSSRPALVKETKDRSQKKLTNPQRHGSKTKLGNSKTSQIDLLIKSQQRNLSTGSKGDQFKKSPGKPSQKENQQKSNQQNCENQKFNHQLEKEQANVEPIVGKRKRNKLPKNPLPFIGQSEKFGSLINSETSKLNLWKSFKFDTNRIINVFKL